MSVKRNVTDAVLSATSAQIGRDCLPSGCESEVERTYAAASCVRPREVARDTVTRTR